MRIIGEETELEVKSFTLGLHNQRVAGLHPKAV